MRRQGQDVMQVNLAGIRRDIMNLAHNYSNAQVISKVFSLLYITTLHVIFHYLYVLVFCLFNDLNLKKSKLNIIRTNKILINI